MIELFDHVSNLTVFISVLLALIILLKFNHLFNYLKIVGIYLVVSASLDIASTAYYSIQENNIMFLHVFTLFEIVILSYLFNLLFTNLKSKFNIKWLAILVSIFVLFNSIFIQEIYIFNTYSAIVVSIIIIAYCIHFFILILELKSPNFQFITLKWFVICLFIYHSVYLIFMSFGNLLSEITQEAQSYIWIFRSVVILSTKLILLFYFSKLLFSKSNLNLNE